MIKFWKACEAILTKKKKKREITLPKLPKVAMLRNTCLDLDCVHDIL